MTLPQTVRTAAGPGAAGRDVPAGPAGRDGKRPCAQSPHASCQMLNQLSTSGGSQARICSMRLVK